MSAFGQHASPVIIRGSPRLPSRLTASCPSLSPGTMWKEQPIRTHLTPFVPRNALIGKPESETGSSSAGTESEGLRSCHVSEIETSTTAALLVKSLNDLTADRRHTAGFYGFSYHKAAAPKRTVSLQQGFKVLFSTPAGIGGPSLPHPPAHKILCRMYFSGSMSVQARDKEHGTGRNAPDVPGESQFTLCQE